MSNLELSDKIAYISSIPFTNVQADNTFLSFEEAVAFAATLTKYLSWYNMPIFGSFAIYGWPDNGDAEKILSFDFHHGDFNVDGAGSSTEIVKSTIEDAIVNPRTYYSATDNPEAAIFGQDGRINSGLYRSDLLQPLLVMKTDHGRFLCSCIAESDNAANIISEIQIMLAAMWTFSILADKDQKLRSNCITIGRACGVTSPNQNIRKAASRSSATKWVMKMKTKRDKSNLPPYYFR